MDKYILSPQELNQIKTVLDECQETYNSAECEAFIKQSKLIANKLPKDLLSFLHRLGDEQTHNGIAIISGFSPSNELPATPKTWHKEDSYTANFDSDYFAIILASILGDPFGFETQQTGKLIHDIVPIKGREYHQEGANSLQMLNLHTEDTFHPYRADFICLHCLKNPDSIGTLVAGVHNFALTEDDRNTLFEDRFLHLSDNTHKKDVVQPLKESILYGNPSMPYIRFDYDFTVAAEGDVKAANAIIKLNEEIQANLLELPLAPGDFCFVDNYKWLHGRKSFKANYDGHDRWLRRFNIKVDLNEAAGFKVNPESRMLSFEPV